MAGLFFCATINYPTHNYFALSAISRSLFHSGALPLKSGRPSCNHYPTLKCTNGYALDFAILLASLYACYIDTYSIA